MISTLQFPSVQLILSLWGCYLSVLHGFTKLKCLLAFNPHHVSHVISSSSRASHQTDSAGGADGGIPSAVA